MVRSIRNGLAPFFLLASTEAVDSEIKFTYLPAEDLVQNYLRNPSGQAQFRNIVSSDRSCFALFANGHIAGKNTITNEYLIPDGGVILSTGNPSKFSENDSNEMTTNFREDTGEPDLESQLSNEAKVFDHCYIQFEFQCPAPESELYTPAVNLDYVFGSDEYSKDHDGGALDTNDAFGVFLNGENIALVPDDTAPVTVNNINKKKNSEYFIENELTGRINQTSPFPAIEADGFTTKLRASAATLPGWNSIKLVIGDVGDGSVDSWVLLEAESFSCTQRTATSTTSSNLRPTKKPSSPPRTAAPSYYPTAAAPSSNPTTTATVNSPLLTNSLSQDEVLGSRPWQMPMPLAVSFLAILGVIALLIPVCGLGYYNKKGVAPA